jgi:hypothetical protein
MNNKINEYCVHEWNVLQNDDITGGRNILHFWLNSVEAELRRGRERSSIVSEEECMEINDTKGDL